MTQKLRRFSTLFLALFLLSTVVVGAIPTKKASAAGTGSAISETVFEKVKRKNNYMFLRACYAHIDVDTVTQDDMAGWDFFSGTSGFDKSDNQDQLVGNIYGPGEKAVWSCFDGANIQRAYGWLGFDNPREAFCAIDGAGVYKDDTGPDTWIGDTTECISREMVKEDHWDIKYNDNNQQFKEFEDSIKTSDSRVTGSGDQYGVTGGLADYEEYVRYYQSFVNQCGEGDSPVEIIKDSYQAGDADASNLYQLTVVAQDGTTKSVLAKGQSSEDSQVAIYAEASGGTEYKSGGQGGDTGVDTWPRGTVVTCNSAKNKANDLANAYKNYIKTHPNDPIADPTTLGSSTSSGKTGPTCESENGDLAWIGCGILRMMDGVVAALDSAISDLLFIDDNKFDNSSVTNAWAVMRNIALLLLIPMMLFMVIGTALEFGPFDAYTVKKSLPRMMAAVVFIVLSLALTQFAVKLSNTVGGGVANLIYSAMPEGQKIGSLQDVFGGGSAGGSEGALFAGLSAGGLVIGGFSGAITWGVLGSLALVTIVALLIGAIILIVRQVLVIFLMILAPLAILVWIFPGNDKLWKIWKSTFIAMLLMYPIIMLLIVSGRFFAGIV